MACCGRVLQVATDTDMACLEHYVKTVEDSVLMELIKRFHVFVWHCDYQDEFAHSVSKRMQVKRTIFIDSYCKDNQWVRQSPQMWEHALGNTHTIVLMMSNHALSSIKYLSTMVKEEKDITRHEDFRLCWELMSIIELLQRGVVKKLLIILHGSKDKHGVMDVLHDVDVSDRTLKNILNIESKKVLEQVKAAVGSITGNSTLDLWPMQRKLRGMLDYMFNQSDSRIHVQQVSGILANLERARFVARLEDEDSDVRSTVVMELGPSPPPPILHTKR